MRDTKTKTMVLAAVLAALTAVLAPLSIPVGPVPVSLGTLCVALVGLLLPPLAGMASLCVYLLLGFVGLPVFTGFRAGPAVLLGPTGGYIFGYFLLALALSLAVRHGWGALGQLAAGYVGTLACYLLGTLWYMVYAGVGFWAAVGLCVAPFVLPDAVKIAAAVALCRALQKRMRRGGTA